jgi:DNA modification methylase
MAQSSKPEKATAESKFDVKNLDCFDFLTSYQGRPFDLGYMDPPYFLDRTFSLEALDETVSFTRGWDDHEAHEFCEDIAKHTKNEKLIDYLSWLFVRLELIHKNMAETGSFFLHIGTREAPYVSLLLDKIFGFSGWRTTITWQRSHPHNNLKKSLGNVSDYIFYYSKGEKYTFNLLHTPHDEVYLANSFSNEDENGPYALAPVIQEKSRRGHFYEYKGVTPPFGWRVRQETLETLDNENRIHWGTNRAYKKVYLKEAQGAALQNIWTDVHNITRTEVDNRKYPTQKPIKLLERIVELSTNPGDLVYDPFCGSGTTLVAALKHGRVALGTDVSPEAVRITLDRLRDISAESSSTLF